MTWERLPPVERPEIPGCATLGSRALALGSDSVIAVGFGTAEVTRDSDLIWSEPSDPYAYLWTLQDAETAALADPDHDWRVILRAPLSNAMYQRHEAGRWILIEQGRGFS